MSEKLILFAWKEEEIQGGFSDFVMSSFDKEALIREGSKMIEDGRADHFQVASADNFDIIYDV